MTTRKFADILLSINSVNASAIEASVDAFVDTIGVALAGTSEDCSVISQRWLRSTQSKPQAVVWGTDIVCSVSDAAFANGISSHALDFDDAMPTLRGHPSATLVPTIMACGEYMNASGLKMLEAYVVGVEVCGILGTSLGAGHYVRGWHTTATVGIFASTVAAARILGLNTEQLINAWGIAASQVSGLVCNFGTMAKPFHAGNAARSAIISASMAKIGFTANIGIFDDDSKFLHTFGDDRSVPLSKLINNIGDVWQVNNPGVFVKKWPCCYCNHRPLGGLIELFDKHQIQLDDVQEVRVGFLPGSDAALISENPLTGLEGKFSIEYCMAATMLDNKLNLDSFTDQMVQRPLVRQIMKKVKRIRTPGEGLFSGVVGYTNLEIDTAKGNYKICVDRIPGSPSWPLSDLDKKDKFLDAAGRSLGPNVTQHLFEQLKNLPKFDHVNDLSKLLTV